MTKAEKEKLNKMLDKAVESYFLFANREDFDQPCVKREILARQSAVFNIADYLHRYGFISWEECCELWSKVGLTDGNEENCPSTGCGANIKGKCKYVVEGVI